MSKQTFYVWRRNDGHVNATNGAMPQGWTTPTGEVTFEQLLVTDDWAEVRERIEQERAPKAPS